MAVKTKEEEMMDIMAEEIRKEIDGEIMYSGLVKSGWTPVKFTYTDRYHAVDVDFWLEDNCKEKWTRHHGCYLFKNKEDAEWFILRWL